MFLEDLKIRTDVLPLVNKIKSDSSSRLEGLNSIFEPVCIEEELCVKYLLDSSFFL